MKKIILTICVFSISFWGIVENSLFAQQQIFLASSAKRGTGKIPKWPCGETSEDTIQSIQTYWQNIQFVPPFDFCGKVAVCFAIDTIDNLTVAKVNIPFQLNDSVYRFRNMVSDPDTDFAIQIIPKDHLGNILNIKSILDRSKVNQPIVSPNSNGWYELINYDAPAKKIIGAPEVIIDITNLSTPSMIIEVDFLLGYISPSNPSSFTPFQTEQQVMAGPPCLYPGNLLAGGDNNLRVKTSVVSNENIHTLIFPNPIEKHFSVKFDTYVNTEIRIELFDLNGKLLMQETTHLDEYEKTIHVKKDNLKKLPKGMFILKVSGNGFSNTHKLTKI